MDFSIDIGRLTVVDLQVSIELIDNNVGVGLSTLVTVPVHIGACSSKGILTLRMRQSNLIWVINVDGRIVNV